ncbi:MAG TPA: HAMP domain-containing sensor histidine kinase [Candidatus Saccharimonadales bacterium]|nr:HAMP domain-containing sensor histidine kinase [Candidatus Saccharimonadales bacterium]
MNLFYSARLKLTGFYFAVLVLFCLLLTFGVRAFTSYELSRGDDAQRGVAHQIFRQYSIQYNIDNEGQTGPVPYGDRFFGRAIRSQADITREHINRDLLLIDILLLGAGAVLSYWYAGRTLQPIEEAHERQKRFTSDASHELRTPLASMKLENEVFLRQKHFEEQDARELIASNLEEVERLERLATNLLALNQYEQGAVAKQPVRVQEVIDEAVTRATQRSTQKTNPRFTLKIAPATVQTDRESLVELMTILIDNAAKYGPKDGEVVVGGEKRGDGYVLAVRDHGPGIAEEDMPHIFERMYRGDKARSSKVSGHGIGLSLAKQIAEANGAKIEVSNHPDGGALFIVSLP